MALASEDLVVSAVKHLAAEDVEALLLDWERLNVVLLQIPIEAVRELLAEAVSRNVRQQVKLRIYQRYSYLRRHYEHEALAKGVLPWQITCS